MRKTNVAVHSIGRRGVSRKQRIFALAFLELRYFPSEIFSQKTQISEKVVKLASRELNVFIAAKCFMATKTAKICQMLQAANAELLYEEADTSFTMHIKISKLKN
jgi:hypothetical protein